MKLMKARNMFLVMALSAVAVVPFTPVGAAETAMAAPVQTDIAYKIDGTRIAINPCQGTGQSNPGSSTQTVVLAGEGTAAGAVAVRAFCGVVQNGRVVGGVQTALPGSVAVTAGTVPVPLAPYTICADIYALFVDGGEVYDYNCPAH
jgi:hypothetical protein